MLLDRGIHRMVFGAGCIKTREVQVLASLVHPVEDSVAGVQLDSGEDRLP